MVEEEEEEHIGTVLLKPVIHRSEDPIDTRMTAADVWNQTSFVTTTFNLPLKTTSITREGLSLTNTVTFIISSSNKGSMLIRMQQLDSTVVTTRISGITKIRDTTTAIMIIVVTPMLLP